MNFQIEAVENVEIKWYDELINEFHILSQTKALVIYGSALYGQHIHDELAKHRISVACICDDDVRKHGTYRETAIKSLESAYEELGKDAVVIIGSYSENNVIEKMQERAKTIGFSQTYYTKKFMLPSLSKKDLEKNYDKINQVYGCLADEESRITFTNILKARLSGDSDYLKETISAGLQYFDKEIISFDQNTVYLDIGAYNGDTIGGFTTIAKDYKKIYGMEVEDSNFLELQSFVSNIKNAEVFHVGAFNENTEIKIRNNFGQNTAIDDTGDCTVSVVKVDDFFGDKEIPTYIKMDIEGAESCALEGAQNIIRNTRPQLAVCVYHKADDLWDLPMQVLQYNKDYKFYLRNYYDRYLDIVCYAV